VPFGGSKGSSYGPREQGRYAVEFYTTVKTAYVYPGSSRTIFMCWWSILPRVYVTGIC
jgi:hypothetical protein